MKSQRRTVPVSYYNLTMNQPWVVEGGVEGGGRKFGPSAFVQSGSKIKILMH